MNEPCISEHCAKRETCEHAWLVAYMLCNSKFLINFVVCQSNDYRYYIEREVINETE